MPHPKVAGEPSAALSVVGDELGNAFDSVIEVNC
jgi:hypothetical protein